VRFLLAAIAGYAIGSVSFAVLIGRRVGDIDVRQHGSGTAGGANVGSLLGVRYGVLVACLDIAKGMFAVIAGRVIGGRDRSDSVRGSRGDRAYPACLV